MRVHSLLWPTRLIGVSGEVLQRVQRLQAKLRDSMKTQILQKMLVNMMLNMTCCAALLSKFGNTLPPTFGVYTFTHAIARQRFAARAGKLMPGKTSCRQSMAPAREFLLYKAEHTLAAGSLTPFCLS